jgi:hypothetical protein
MPNLLSAQTQRGIGPKYQLSNGFNEVDAEESVSVFERSTTTPTGSTDFDGNAVTANVLNGDVIYAARLKKGSRIFSGRLITEALGASVTISVGTVENPTLFLAATSVAAASTTEFASTYATGACQVLAADTWLILTVAGANPTLASMITGFIRYAKN